jgi:phenylalanyl-tRNA synthetase beta chain
MRVPFSWLRDFIELELAAQEAAELLTRSGVEVEEITSLAPEFSGVVTAQVLSAEKHPQADRLYVTKVFDGREQLTVVAGVANMKPGDIVPLATVGACLPGGLKIGAVKRRGIESCGMLCSAKELGLEFSAGTDGILVLDKGTQPGLPLEQALNLNDPILLLGLTPNRADCLGLLGVAYELAALTGRQVRLPDLLLHDVDHALPQPRIEIAAPSLCSRYAGLLFKDVRVGTSPLWLQVRLIQAGIRPINNIVDVTNYCMWELGQPLHAFDYETLDGRAIVVRTAREGEKIVTLDEQERKLTPEMLVIADAAKPVAVAGVMGGRDTEITADTTTVLLEAAHFNPVSIRRTGRSLGLYSEAQQRFEKGVDVNGCVQAACRAADLLRRLGAARPAGEVVDVCAVPGTLRQISLRPERARKLLGLQISQKEMASIFRRQGFVVEEGTQLHITVPTRRADLQAEVDLIEEVARIHGYENIPATLPAGVVSQGFRSGRQLALKKLRETMTSCGYTEVINYSFLSTVHFDSLGLNAADKLKNAVSVANPLSEEQAVMRTQLTAGLLDNVVYNRNRHQLNTKLFELGAVYFPAADAQTALPEQRLKLGLVITGVFPAEHWRDKPVPCDFFDLKGTVEEVLERLGVSGVSFQDTELPWCQTGQTAQIRVRGEQAGWLGRIHEETLEAYDLDGNVFAGELDVETLLPHVRLNSEYRPLPRYPALLRDMAVIVPDQVSADRVTMVISEAGGPWVETVTLFDLYRGPQVPAGCRSLAYAITYRDVNRTLSDEDATRLHSKIEKALEEKLGAGFRK